MKLADKIAHELELTKMHFSELIEMVRDKQYGGIQYAIVYDVCTTFLDLFALRHSEDRDEIYIHGQSR